MKQALRFYNKYKTEKQNSIHHLKTAI